MQDDVLVAAAQYNSQQALAFFDEAGNLCTDHAEGGIVLAKRTGQGRDLLIDPGDDGRTGRHDHPGR